VSCPNCIGDLWQFAAADHLLLTDDATVYEDVAGRGLVEETPLVGLSYRRVAGSFVTDGCGLLDQPSIEGLNNALECVGLLAAGTSMLFEPATGLATGVCAEPVASALGWHGHRTAGVGISVTPSAVSAALQPPHAIATGSGVGAAPEAATASWHGHRAVGAGVLAVPSAIGEGLLQRQMAIGVGIPPILGAAIGRTPQRGAGRGQCAVPSVTAPLRLAAGAGEIWVFNTKTLAAVQYSLHWSQVVEYQGDAYGLTAAGVQQLAGDLEASAVPRIESGEMQLADGARCNVPMVRLMARIPQAMELTLVAAEVDGAPVTRVYPILPAAGAKPRDRRIGDLARGLRAETWTVAIGKGAVAGPFEMASANVIIDRVRHGR
jgi:hypothetical protein